MNATVKIERPEPLPPPPAKVILTLELTEDEAQILCSLGGWADANAVKHPTTKAFLSSLFCVMEKAGIKDDRRTVSGIKFSH